MYLMRPSAERSHQGVAQDMVREQLKRILASDIFANSRRLSRFLEFVVERGQEGRADDLKEYAIGMEVFDRGQDFDPRIDPIVRVQAAKLRSKLMEYYASSGAQDPVVISIPKGSYAPKIQEQKPAVTGEAPRPALERSRIAVLPFVNMSSDPENEYFSDGLTEELINRLACIPDLQVVARTSVFRFKGRNEDLREIGAKLNVGTVMEGSVRKAGDQLRVTAQLIDVNSGFHLFSQTYQREYKGVFELQDELAQAVVDKIVPLSASGASPVIVKTRAVNLDAYNIYLRGMFALSNRFTERQAWIELFQKALAIDAEHAPAWAGLAHGYFMLAWFYQMPARQAMPLCKDAALRTLDLDPKLALGHASLGIVEGAYEWNWAAAEARFQRAIELQPGLAVIYQSYAVCCLLPQLRMDEACSVCERAVALDPFNPLTRAMAAFVYANAGRYEDAIRQQTLGLEINPNFAPFYYTGGLAHEWHGQLDQAISSYRRTAELGGGLPSPLGALGHALALSGQKKDAEQIVGRLLKIPDQPAVDIATVYLGLRKTEEALDWLEVAVKQQNMRLLTVPPDRRFQWLSRHPRFERILRQMGLPTGAAGA
jgi:TolB-like protein